MSAQLDLDDVAAHNPLALRELAALRADAERLRAAIEVLRAATDAAVSKARWQAVTNKELNEQYAKLAALREALDWYAGEARACARHSHSGNHTSGEALLVSVTLLALDGGKRADAAMAAHKEPSA